MQAPSCCAGYLWHRKEHTGFTAKVIDLQERTHSGELVLSLEVITSLRDWLTGHILASDKTFGAFLNSRSLH